MTKYKWTVLGAEAMNGWLVVHPGEVLRGSDGRLDCWVVHSRHHTWEEAMQEADRMSRTKKIELPAYQNPTTIDAEPASPVTIYTAGTLTQIEAGGVRLNLFRHELEQVAEVLLTHARKEAI